MSSLFKVGRPWRWMITVATVAALTLVMLAANTSIAAAVCNTTGSPSVATDKPDYGANETVFITGSGFVCGATLTVRVTRPDGSVVKGDGSETPGSDTVTADDQGAFTYSYQLVNGQESVYTVDVLNTAGTVLATTTFTDSHFRYGQIHWTRTPGTRTVIFSVTTAWLSDNVGFVCLNFGDGTSTCAKGAEIAGATDSQGNSYAVMRFRASHTYASDGPFTAFFNACCRVGGIENAFGYFKVTAVVDLLGGNNGSPVSSLPVIVQMDQGKVNRLSIPVVDPQGDSFTCRLGTRDEATSGLSSVYTTPSAGGRTLGLSSDCVMTWNTSDTTIGQLWAVHISIEETDNATRVESDFLIEIVGNLQNESPSCTLNGSSSNVVQAGRNFTITMTGTDPDGGNLKINHLGLAPGSTLTPSAGTSGASPLTGTFSWTPVASDVGTAHAVTITFTDPGGLKATCGFSIRVLDPSAPVNPLTPSEVIQDLVGSVEELDLPIENSLVSTLNAAIASLDRENYNAATNQLTAFVNKVEADRGKKISDADADALIRTADAIRDVITSGG